MKYDVSYRSDLYEVGVSDDGQCHAAYAHTAYAHTVMIEMDNGQRFLLSASTVRDTTVKNNRVINNSPAALTKIEKLVKKVEEHLKAGGLLNPMYWKETYSYYGSDSSNHIPMEDHKIFMKGA